MPDDHFEEAMLWTFLDQVYVVVLYHLVCIDYRKADRAEALCLADYFSHRKLSRNYRK
jgi:hypothetical protein